MWGGQPFGAVTTPRLLLLLPVLLPPRLQEVQSVTGAADADISFFRCFLPLLLRATFF